MSFILTLSVSGSCMVGLVFLAAKVGRGFFTRGWECFMLKISMIFFLVPMSFLKEWFAIIFDGGGAIAVLLSITPVTSFDYKNVLVANDSFMVPNILLLINGIICILWIAYATYLFTKNLYLYFVFRKTSILIGEKILDQDKLELLEELRRKYGIYRKVLLYTAEDSVSTFTIGVLSPVIFVSEQNMDSSFKVAICHELTHIKNWDAGFRILQILVASVHWFNPVIRILQKGLNESGEFACDERTTRNLTKEEREKYSKALIDSLTEDKKERPWSATLTQEGVIVGERIKIIMNNSKITKLQIIASASALAVMLFASSMTAFAYEDVNTIEVSNINTEEAGGSFQTANFEFFDATIKEQIEYPVTYEKQFVNAEGDVLPIKEDNGISTYWPHTCKFETGYMQAHNRKSGGACIVVVYNAERCTICGDCVLLSVYSTTNYTKCPH